MLDADGPGVEGGGGVVAVEPDVEGEVVAGAGGHAHEGQVVGQGHRRHHPERAVAAGHAQGVGAVGDRRLGQGRQVVVGTQHHRLHAQRLAPLGQAGPLGRTTAAVRVDQEDRSLHRPPGPIDHDVALDRRGLEAQPGGQAGQGEGQRAQGQAAHPAVAPRHPVGHAGHEQADDADQGEGGHVPPPIAGGEGDDEGHHAADQGGAEPQHVQRVAEHLEHHQGGAEHAQHEGGQGEGAAGSGGPQPSVEGLLHAVIMAAVTAPGARR